MATVDPIEAALSGAANTQQTSDPIEQALASSIFVQKAPTKAKSVSPASSFLSDPLFWRDVGSNTQDLGRAFLHNAMSLPHGGAQFIENIAGGLAQRIAPDSPVANAIANVAMKDSEAMAQRERQYQSKVPDSAASYVGATAGQIAPFVFGGELQKGLNLLGRIPTESAARLAQKVPGFIAPIVRAAGRSVGGALQGAAISSAAPSFGPNYAAEKGTQAAIGGAVGGAIPPAVSTVKGIYQVGKGLLAPFTNPQLLARNAAERIAGSNAQQVVSRASNPEIFVKGSIPTTAQAAPTPELIQAEKTLANNPALKPQFVERELQNNAARIAAVQSVAGAPGELEQAVQERNRIAKNLYDWAFSHQEPITPWMKGQVTQLVKRPAIQGAMKDARRLAANEGIKFNDATSVQGLHYVKTALDDKISSALRQGNNNEARVLIGTRDKLLTLMEKISPTYAQARQEFAAASRPINTMEVANELLDKLNTNAYDANGMPKIDYRGYKSALSKAVNNSEYGIDPQAQAVLEGVQKDLQRTTISNSIRVPGSDTAFNLKAPGWLAHQVYGDNFSGPTRLGRIGGMVLGSAVGEAVMPGHTLAALAVGGGTGLKLGERIGAEASKRVNAQMASALLNPQEFATLLKLPKDVQQSVIEKLMATRGVPALAYSANRQPIGLLNTKP